jgi:aerobic-type carbon monoxide dehydrogenase small subunit (CoxS/CutS family)
VEKAPGLNNNTCTTAGFQKFTYQSKAGNTAVNPRLSRRRFLKTVIASSVAATTTSGLQWARADDRARGAVERLISLNINGRPRRVDVLPQETLAYTLRYKLGLTGTKIGCNRGECGACTVLIDDVTHYSCSTLTHSVRSSQVLTVEGLQGPDGQLHPVQQAFIDELAPQCGFCTPGQVMAAVGLLKANPRPSREEARHAMSGNLCRCGAYDHYLNGVMRAAGTGTRS